MPEPAVTIEEKIAMNNEILIFEDKKISPYEFINLMQAVVFGDKSDYTETTVSESLSAYPFIAYARNNTGELIGYVSAFSDHAFSTFIGELAVHPSFQRRGVGHKLISAVEKYSGKAPIYVNPFKDTEQFFLKQGFKRASRSTTALFKAA